MIFCTISASFFACISWKEIFFVLSFFWEPYLVWISFFKTLLSPSISFFDFNRPSSPRILGWNMFSSLKRSTRRCVCYCCLPWSMSVCHVAFITLLAFEEYFALFTSKQANIVHLQKSRYRDTLVSCWHIVVFTLYLWRYQCVLDCVTSPQSLQVQVPLSLMT